MIRRFVPLVSMLALAACGGPDSNDASAEAPPSQTSGQTDDGAAARQATQTAAAEPGAPAGVQTASDETGQDASAILAALGPDYQNADLSNGARQFRRCQSCHTLNEGGRHTVGPNLHGIIGREAAAAEGFSYSRQLSESGLVWDAETLDAWIENPRALVPGNRMSFVGLRDAEDRRDVISYMAVETAD